MKPQTGSDPVQASDDLAETGSSSSTPYIAGAAAVLLAAGAGCHGPRPQARPGLINSDGER